LQTTFCSTSLEAVDAFHRPRPSHVLRAGLTPFPYMRDLGDRKYFLRPGLFAFLELGAATKIDEKLPKYPYRCRAGCSDELMAVGRWKGVIGSVISPVEGSSLFYYFITARMGQVLRATSGWADDGASVYLSFCV